MWCLFVCVCPDQNHREQGNHFVDYVVFSLTPFQPRVELLNEFGHLASALILAVGSVVAGVLAASFGYHLGMYG